MISSTSIFNFQSSSSSEPISKKSIQGKRQNFRLSIRRTELDSKFNQIRKKLLGEIQSDTFKNLLESISIENYPKIHMEDFMKYLDQNGDDATFYQSIAKSGLENSLIKLLLNKNTTLSLIQKICLMRSLVYLTFYIDESSINIIRNQDILDFLRSQIALIAIECKNCLLEVQYLLKIVGLLLNLASNFKEDFNLYLIESDISLELNRKIAKTINFLKEVEKGNDHHYLVQQLRKDTIKLYKNIITKIKEKPIAICQIVRNVLQDQVYIEHFHIELLEMFTEAVKKKNVWELLIAEERTDYMVSRSIEEILWKVQNRCTGPSYFSSHDHFILSQTEFKEFYAVLNFLNELHESEEDELKTELSWINIVETLVHQSMLADFVIESVLDEEHGVNVLYASAAIKMYKNMSNKLQMNRLLQTRGHYAQNYLIKIFTTDKLIQGGKCSRNCLKILANLLKKSYQIIPVIMEHRIVDSLEEIFLNESDQEILAEAVHLSRMLIYADQEYNSNKQQNILVSILQSKNIIKKIQLLQDHSNRRLSQISENFMSYLENLLAENK